jgi:integrase
MGVRVREKVKGSGEWWIFIDHKGKRKAKKVGKDRRLAIEVAKKIEAKLLLGQLDLDKKKATRTPTLKEYVLGWADQDRGGNIGWLDKYARLALKRSTWTVYENLLKVHIIPELGNHALDRISSRDIADVIVKKVNSGLRSQTVKNIKNCLSSILQYAYSPDGYIDSNPARGIIVPKPENEKPARKPNPYSWDERRVVESAFSEHYPEYYPLVLTAFRTGLRMGELLALQWKDIDFLGRLILVTRNIAAGKVTTPKSHSGVRQVRMTKQLCDELKGLLTMRKEQKLRKGWKEVPEWIFCNERGNFLNYNNFLNRIWNRAMEKTGLRRRTPHDMRHTYATLRLSKGDSLAEVSKEMGHSSSDITYRTYYTWLPRESRTDIDELDDFHVVTKILSDTDLRTRSTSQTVIGAEVDHQ